MKTYFNRARLLLGLTAFAGWVVLPAYAADQDPINPPPTLRDYQALAKLPDFSGVWTPVIKIGRAHV